MHEWKDAEAGHGESLSCVVLKDSVHLNCNVQDPSNELIHKVKAQVLKDTASTLLTSFEDAFRFVERCPHKRLWTLLGDHAISRREFQHAVKAFVRLNDYNRIQFTKQVGFFLGPI